MRAGIDVSVAASNGETKSVTDRCAAEHLVVPHQTGKDLQPGCVRARPALGATRIRVERKYRARSRLPPPGPAEGIQLVQDAVVAVDDEHVSIAVGTRIVACETAFDP